MTVTRLIDDSKILKELVNWLRSSDLFTTTQRGVTTTTAVGTFAADTSLIINRTNVKNIRSVVVASVTLTYGTDWDFALNYDNAGTTTARITFTAAQTGAYTITYDYGNSDSIYDDLSRTDISLSSYPRADVDLTSTATVLGELGGAMTLNDLLISFNIFDDNKTDTRNYNTSLRRKILEAQRSFYNFRYITPVASSPLLPQPDRHDLIVLKTLECRCPDNEEVTT